MTMTRPGFDPVSPTSARQVTRTRRRASRTRTWRAFRSHRGGMLGLVVLVDLHRPRACFAPVLFPPSTISVTQATGEPMSPPTAGFPLGTDESGRSILALIVWGARISLVVGLAPRSCRC